MSIKESALNAITSITQSDFIRAVTAAGASRRVTVANLAKAIIESYTGSSLAGENQSVKAALDALNSNIGACSIKNFSNPGGSTTAEVPLTAKGIIFVLSVVRSANTNNDAEGYGLIKYYNNDAHLTRVVGLSNFSVTMSNGNAVITMAPYTNVMLICISQ